MERMWENVFVNINTVDWRGNPMVLHNVPAKRNLKTQKLKVIAEEVARTELRNIAESVGIHERDILLLLMLYAKPGPFPRGYLSQKYKLNKMLFLSVERIGKRRVGEAISHDEFISKARGPVPNNLWDDLKRLKKQGLIEVEGGRQAKKTVTCELTEKGEKIAKGLWERVPDPYLSVTVC